MSQSTDDDAGTGHRPRRRTLAAEPTPAQRALGLLVRREHSRKELTRKLQAKGVAKEEANAAVEQMTEAGWQSNERFAENLVRSRASQGYGPLRIRAELAMHGLDAEAVRNAIEAYEGDWNRIAFELIQRRFGTDPSEDRERQRKAGEFLLRRGFSMEQTRRATQSNEFDDCFEG